MNARITPYLLIAPSLGFLTVLFFLPLVQTIALAFQADSNWSTANFARMAGDLNFADAVVNTFEIVVIVVPLQLLLALAMTMMLQHVRGGRDIVLWIWSIPLGISDLAAGLVWLAILTDKGYLNTILLRLGVLSGPQSWLSYETPVTLRPPSSSPSFGGRPRSCWSSSLPVCSSFRRSTARLPMYSAPHPGNASRG